MIYCDNAATTFPKPQKVYDAVQSYMSTIGASPGRSAHSLSIAADRIMFDTRESLASLFAIKNSRQIAFTHNATEALNIIISGMLKPGDHVLTSGMEHNSVMRPLRHLEKTRGIQVTVLPCSATGLFDLALWEDALKTGAELVIVNHGSNVIGSLAPLADIGVLCRKYGTIFCVDAAQTAGYCDINVDEMHIDALAFSGHKGLYGPQGTGAVYIRESVACEPLKFGGTGSHSESDEQPDFYPDCLESGTQNGPGIAGLGAGVAFVMEQGLDNIRSHGAMLTRKMIDVLSTMPAVKVHGIKDPDAMLPTLSLTFANADCGVVAQRLDKEYGIAARVGLHCSPWAHRTMGTFPKGTLRISFGYFNTENDVEEIGNAIRKIVG